jgi:hypothetical protein
MTKKYQTTVPEATGLAVPEQVSIVMEEIAAGCGRGCWPSRSAPACRSWAS